jgi:poly(A) polymerase
LEQASSPPHIIPRAAHCISRSNISESATKVLYRLKNAGYEAFLVGGSVRDLLLGRQPKDFDIATDAHPEDVRKLFSNCRLIGRRFRLAHVHFKGEIIEVATFRASHVEGEEGEHETEEGRILRDNVYGTIDEDAWRRDFTVNALYYNIRDFSVWSYASGIEDLEHGTLRLIGDPETRYREDPVRMLRAVRFATKLGFRLHPDTEAPIFEMASLLDGIPSSRLYEEVLKLFLDGFALQNFELLRHYNLFRHLFPETDALLDEDPGGPAATLLTHGLGDTDLRIEEGKPVTPAFLFAVLLWPVYMAEHDAALAECGKPFQAVQLAGSRTVSLQAQHIAIPKRFSYPMRDIWALQPRFASLRGKRPFKLFASGRFRAAWDFLLLRSRSGENLAELCDWWARFQEASESERFIMTKAKGASKRQRNKKPRTGPIT